MCNSFPISANNLQGLRGVNGMAFFISIDEHLQLNRGCFSPM